MLTPPEDLRLENACNTDEIYDLALRLAGWALRHGMDSEDVVDWVLDQPREAQLPRGSRGRLNPTEHHVHSGATNAVEGYDPLRARSFDPDPLHELAARVAESGVTHERYLLGVIALCFEYTTLTPVVTGPSLARVACVADQVASKVLRQWSTTLAYGFFTRVTYDGVPTHGRVWTIDPSWVPVSRPAHLPGCNRSKDRCLCPGVSQNGLSIITAVKDRSPKVRHFEKWATSLKPGTGITVTDTCKATGATRAAATKVLREAEGSILKVGTFAGGRVYQRGRFVKQGETWFTQDGKG